MNYKYIKHLLLTKEKNLSLNEAKYKLYLENIIILIVIPSLEFICGLIFNSLIIAMAIGFLLGCINIHSNAGGLFDLYSSKKEYLYKYETALIGQLFFAIQCSVAFAIILYLYNMNIDSLGVLSWF